MKGSMKAKIYLVLLVVLASVVASGCSLIFPVAPEEPTTSTSSVGIDPKDIEEKAPANYQRAVASKKPKLLFFTIASDPTGPDVGKSVDGIVKDFGSKIAYVRVRADQKEWGIVVGTHDVKYFPTIIILDGNGAEKKRFEGFVDRKSMERVLDQLLGR